MRKPADPEARGCQAPCLNGERNTKCIGRGCLVARAMSGDPIASEMVFERLAQVLLGQARHLCSDRADAEDLVQEALLHAWEHLQQLREKKQLLPWARSIVRNSFLMSRRRSLFAPARLDGLEAHESVLVVEARILERLAAAEAVRRLSRALDQLPSKLRRTFELRVLGGLSTEETARKLGVTRFVVRTRLRRARIALSRAAPYLWRPA